MRKEPFTTETFFNEVVSILKEKNQYRRAVVCTATDAPVPISRRDFKIKNGLYAVGKETHLTLFIKFPDDDKLYPLGEAAVSNQCGDWFSIMDEFLMNFISAASDLRAAHPENFLREGFLVTDILHTRTKHCADMSMAEKVRDGMLTKYKVVYIYDLEKRTVTKHSRPENGQGKE